MKLRIAFDLDSDRLPHYTDEHLAQLWHIAQANPAPYGDRDACRFAEGVGREIVRRWLAAAPVALWTHQAAHLVTLPAAEGVSHV